MTAPTTVMDPRLVRWERNTRWVIVLAALIPLLGTLSHEDTPRVGQVSVDLATWFVFLVDFVVHLRLRRGYLRTWQGAAYALIIFVTFPWYLIPALRGSELQFVTRLARLARIMLLVVKGGLVTLIVRLGKTAVFAVTLVVASAIVVQRAEPPGTGFDSFGDSLWWAIVTITTVGYGDLVPETDQGRIAASILMIGGLAVLGSIAAIMAAYIRGEDLEAETAAMPEASPGVQHVLDELAALDRKLDSIGSFSDHHNTDSRPADD